MTVSTKQTKQAKPSDSPKYVFGFGVNMPDPRVSIESAEYGKRTVCVVFGIDSRGALWREIDTEAPVFLGFPPPLP